MTGIVALDCESNGLHGQVFAAAVSVQEDGREIGGWTARCPIEGDVDPWVAEHVLPTIEDVPITVCLQGGPWLQPWGGIGLPASAGQG